MENFEKRHFGLEFGALVVDLRVMLRFALCLLLGSAAAALLAGCASTPDSGSWLDTAANSACLTARVLKQRCAAGAEHDSDRCATAEMLAAICDKASAEPQGIAAILPASPGAGYVPRTLATYWREYPGAPTESRGTGDPQGDPWQIACSGKTGPELAACYRSRYLAASPAVCAEYRRAFGVTTCGSPGGGWTRGPSNERWGSAREALNWFCVNDPAVIGSTGRAGGWDCESTAVEWARLGAFGGEAIVTEWQRRTAGPPPPPAPRCGDHHADPGETCENCPADLGPCAPPPPPDPRLDCSSLSIPAPDAPRFVGVRAGTDSTGLAGYRLLECRGGSLPAPEPERPVLLPATRATLAALCGWYPRTWKSRRAQCAAAVSEVLGVDRLEVTP